MKNNAIRLPQIMAAAAMMTMFCAVPALAASGWQKENGSWIYLDRNGNRVTDTWKKNDAGDRWFYLEEDGNMAVSKIIEQGDDYYYVNEDGARVTNEWRLLEDDSDSDAFPDGTCWYYFGATGKAAKNTSGKARLTTIDGKKYAFDEEGRMLYGWISEDAQRLTDEEGWTDGVYYCGEPGEGGNAIINAWKRIMVDDPEGDDEADGDYWFYFGVNGKKITDTQKTINKRKYLFDDRGVALFKWNDVLPSDASSSNATPSTASASSLKYYNSPDECWRASGWIYTVPTEDIDPEGYADDTEYWFYADKNGKLAISQIKTVDGYKYAFNEKGEMLEGLYALTFDENNRISSYKEIEDIADMPDEDEECFIYYFGNTPKDGVMATKKNVQIELDDDYTFGFRSNGQGIHGISDNAIYIKGRKLKADKDLKIEPVSFNGEEYLVNTTGAIQKKKNNVKDADDTYYCTDVKGKITYRGSEKKTD